MKIKAVLYVMAAVGLLGGARAAELPLTEGVFGDQRLSVAFDPVSGFPTEYRKDGTVLLDRDAAWPAPVAFGAEQPWHKLSATFKEARAIGTVTRVAPDEVKTSLRTGDWQVDTFVKLDPERLLVRRRFEIAWTGVGTGKLERFWVACGRMACPNGRGGFLIPGRFPTVRRTARDFRPNVPNGTDAKFGSHTPVIASGASGWACLAVNDETVPFGDRTRSFVTERKDAASLSVCFQCFGWMPPGVKQTVGDQYLMFRKGDEEAMLRAMPAWFAAVGQHVPEDRGADIKDTILYSDHPTSNGAEGPAKKGFRWLRDYLPYVKALGCNTVWLRPVEDSHPYCPRDYYRLAADVGTVQDFKDYVADAHGLGLKVWRDAVSHGGRNDNPRSREHPEWLACHEDGTSDAFWCYDFFAPGWLDYFGDFIRHETAAYNLDGWRMDAISGSRYPNWSRSVPYARASFAQDQGSLAMTRRIRAKLREANPRGVTLSETHSPVLGTTADAIYDNWGVAQQFYAQLVVGDTAAVVQDYRRYLHERSWCVVPDLVFMRYCENHDHLPAAQLYGQDAALALFATQAWIDGFPMVFDTMEDGAFERYREILRTRAAVEELRRGTADYLGVKAPDGVFACLRSTKETASVVLVNFNSQKVRGTVQAPGYPAFEIELDPLAYAVRRVKGEAVANLVPAVTPVVARETYAIRPLADVPGAKTFEIEIGGRKVPVRAELRNEQNWLHRFDYRLNLEKIGKGLRLRVTDADGRAVKTGRLFLQIPSAERWYARTAEGLFESPCFVRCTAYDDRDGAWSAGHSPIHGARRWHNRTHPFGLTEDYAAVGCTLGDRAVEFTGFADRENVEIWDRIGKDRGFAVVVSGGELKLDFADVPATEALRRRVPGTGDPRLKTVVGGWLWEDGNLQVRIARNGLVSGVRRKEDGVWKTVVKSAELMTTTGTGTRDCIGHTTGLCRQRFENDASIRLRRTPAGGMAIEVEKGWLRGPDRHSGRMNQPIVFRQTFSFGAPDGFALSTRFTTARDLSAEAGRLGYEFECVAPAGEDAYTLENLAFTGAVSGIRRRRGNIDGLYWLGDGQETLKAQPEPGLGFDCFVRVGGSRQPVTGSSPRHAPRAVDVSTRCPRYFETADGKPWIPIGINLCYAHPDESTAYDCPEPETMAKMERWMRSFAKYGGNYIRIFLCRPTFEVLTDQVGVYNAHNGQNIVKLVKIAEELGIKIKFTLEVFRSVRPASEVTDEWGVKCNKPLYAPYAGGTMHGFYTSEECHDIFMGKVRYLASLGLGDSPAVIDWEPFNEISSTGKIEDWSPWSARVLREFQEIFPKQMITQNLGSFSSPMSHVAYDVMGRSEPNAFMQVHRYLDPGAHIRVCRGPMDILCADAIREMLDRRFDKPALLAETGGVLAHHAGPTKVYDLDKNGMFLHDAIFAPFFAGGAGTGCMWHWGQQYVDRWNLWWHYGRFAKAVEGLDPIAEAFVPFHFETTFWRILGLRGKKTTVLWAREIENTWENELIKGIEPTEPRSSEWLPFQIAQPADWYLPFEDRTITVQPYQDDHLFIPRMKRSGVVRFPTAYVAPTVKKGTTRLAGVFTDGAVLQREAPVPVWGTALPGAEVVVTFGDFRLKTTASAEGTWRVTLPPMPACAAGRPLRANDAVADDVLVGEVWIVSGQSNASLPLCGDNPNYRDREGALTAALTENPAIRYAEIRDPWSVTPKTAVAHPVAWRRFTAQNLGDPRTSCCAYAVAFAKTVQGALRIPIGLVCAYSGSTPIEAWIPREGFVARDDLKDYLARPLIPPEKWTDAARNDTFMRRGGFQQPSVMWNARLEPWSPYAVKGVIWYQGCSNQWNAERYPALQEALYDSWSRKFANPDLRFRFVQVVPWPWNNNGTWPIQLAQSAFAKDARRNVAMAVICDIGNDHDAHPLDKGPVGRRLAALALNRDYGFSVKADAPEVVGTRVEGPRLVLRVGACESLYVHHDIHRLKTCFELAGADGKWIRAEIENMDANGRIKGTEIVLSAKGVDEPQRVRYLHCAPYVGTVFNEMGLPLGAFTCSVTGASRSEAGGR